MLISCFTAVHTINTRAATMNTVAIGWEKNAQKLPFVTIRPRRKFVSTSSHRMKLRINGAICNFNLLIRYPSTPKNTIDCASNIRLFVANAPTVHSTSTTGSKMYFGMLNSLTNTLIPPNSSKSIAIWYKQVVHFR